MNGKRLSRPIFATFGLCNAPAVFRNLVNDVLRDFLRKFVFVYLNYIIIFLQSLKYRKNHVCQFLQRLMENHRYVKVEKCEFHVSSITFLALIPKGGHVSADHTKTKTIKDWPVPNTRIQLQRFLGFANFYHRFIKDLSKIAIPLTALNSTKRPSHWTPEADQAFNHLKDLFTQTPILYHPDPTRQLILEVHASDSALEAILYQII